MLLIGGFKLIFGNENLQNKIKSLAENFSKILLRLGNLTCYPNFHLKNIRHRVYSAKTTAYGIPFTSGLVETGVVGLIKGKNPNSKCIALRADIDALPIQELNDFDYTSKNSGVMHACGHDVHTASLLGVGRILNELKEEWEGTIKLIFQPGEEKLPGGASLMIAEGVLENPKVDKIIGQHVSPDGLRCNWVRGGMFMASADEIYIDVIGQEGMQHFLRVGKPLLIASKIITALYDGFDQVKDTLSVFSLGVIEGGSMAILFLTLLVYKEHLGL